MKKLFLIAMTLVLSIGVMGQQSITLRSTDRAECVSSDFQQLRASFSFSTIEAENVDTQRGQFSWLSMPNTVLGGNEGDPQIPVVNELIAVPFGATPRIEITSYSSTDYRLEDYGMQTLIPRQPSLRKDQRPEDVPFVYNAAAYQTRGFRSEPQAVVSVVGTMRGVQLGKMTIEPVSYDPVNNTLRVFNDIEVEVSFDGADARATEQMLVDTYSPYFDIVYKQLLNGRAIRSIYDQHPDLYTTPVKMLVVATSTYANSTAFQNWLTWKKQKGIDVEVLTVANSASASTIQSQIYTKYNANHPSFLVIVGDETIVTNYSMFDYDSNYGDGATDLEYASVDGDVYHDMFLSRMPVSSTTELNNLVNKILTYEKYTMSDPSYLNETLLIAGWDSYWTSKIGKPTIQYANTNYFNSSNGITPHVFITTASGQTTCYNYINNVGFINYTAHGDIQEWYDPNFTNTNVNSLTNNDKYFWAMGNCCLTANFKNAQNSYTCYGEAMVRAANKGAFGYIGSVPESYWFEDFYFGVGAFAAVQGTNNPTVSGTTTGCYDAMFDDTGFNTLNSVPFVGNLAVAYGHAAGYNGSVSDEYYWRAYQCFGDGSVMPYLKVPAANNVSHASSIIGGINSFRVNADAGSYVSITVNNNIIGVAAVPSNATYVDVPFTTTPVPGTTAMIVVTRNQRQPYINNNVPVIDNNLPQYTITANVTPSNSGTVEGAGTYYENTQCTLTAVANHGYAFQKWNDNNTENPRTITVTGNATYTATFRALQEHHVTYTAQQSHGTISVSPTDAYAGDIVTLSATPDAGYSLDHWTVTTNRETIPVENNQFVMPDSEVTVSATFKSEPLTVADGTGTNSEIPFYGLYTDDNYQHTQTIYPASMLTNLQGCQITKLTYYLSSSVSKSFGSTFQVRFGTTTSTAFNSGTANYISITDAPVYSGTLSVNGTTVEFDFSDSPYLYSGGNLVIDVRITALGSGYQSMSFYGESGSTYYSVKSRNTSSLPNTSGTSVSFMPKTTFAFTAPTTDPYISLTPNSATVLTGFTQTLTATYGNVSGTPNITYTSSNNNVATVVGNGTTATVTAVAPGTATITATMTYEGTAYTATCTVTVQEPSLCEPSFSNPSDDYISNFTTTGGTTNINNSSSYVTGGYSDYYNDYSASIDAGGTLSCTVTPSSTQWSYGHAIWVDWNKDYEFTSDERVAYTTSTATGNWTGSVIVPDNTAAGDYHLRVIHLYNNTPTDACMSGTYGEAEDYKLTVLASSNCPTPTITNITATANSATITTDSEASSFNVRYREYVETASTTYDFENGWQGWTAVQGTNGTSPHNWMHNTEYTAYSSNGNVIDLTTSGYNSSTGFMLSESYISAPTSGGTATGAVYPDNYLISPQIRLGGSVTFYAAGRTTDCYEKFTVMVSTTGTNISDFVATSFTVTLDSQTYTQYTVDLSEYSGMGYVIFHHYDCTDQHMLKIDNVTIVAPSMQWQPGNDLTITGLEPATTYEVQVQAICDGEEDPSSWSEIATFTTEEVATETLTITLTEGWNWWAPNMEISLADFEAALGANGVKIQAQNGNVATYSSNGWSGSLTAFEVGKMYKVQTNATCTFTVSGTPVDPAEYPITLASGINWIGLIGTEEMTLDEALINLTPTNLDNIKTINGTAIYYQGRGWRGNISTLVPGEGFIYNSKASTSQTFTYPSAE